MIGAKNITIDGKQYVVSKFPATVGREILLQYPQSAMPKIGDYKTNHALMLRIMGYVGVVAEGRDEPLLLSTETLVNNHVDSAETLIKLEWEMVTHNFSFFKDGRASGFLELVMAKFGASTQKILTGLLRQLSEKS